MGGQLVSAQLVACWRLLSGIGFEPAACRVTIG